ncbi:MAG: 4-hydroxy-tetrahydrodipicolinate synthase [Pseudomonas citronellolis]|nr:MAG: 4-hydroxy-tetrahydrodipicolinate synthase [Pseudomonas citronellolis]
MPSFQGIWVALVTPFNDGRVDFAALQRLVKKLDGEGVAGFVVCGTTGEAAALSEQEQLEVLDAVLGWVPAERVVMGVSGNHLGDLLAFLEQVQQRSLAGVLVPAPYYIRPSQPALEAFFQTVADAARVPVLLYDIPYRTGVRIERETLRRIVQHPNIAAVKDCSGDPETAMALIADGHVQVLAGEDSQIFSTLCLGGSGAISASAHVQAPLYVRLVEEVASEHLSAARRTFYRLLPWIRMAFAEPNPAAVKTALALQGVIGDEVRAPMLAGSPALRQHLEVLLATFSD